MRASIFELVVAVVCGVAIAMAWWLRPSILPVKPVEPEPTPIVKPTPKEPDTKKPRRRPRGEGYEKATVGGPTAPDGTEVQCDLPLDQHLRNKGGSDGAGLCVFCSIDHSARWQNVAALEGFRDWMTKYPGGGYPEKVTQMVEKLCKEKGVPIPDMVQVEGTDLEILKLACKTGRMPGITYAYSPSGRYNGQRIAHMTSLVFADDHWFAVLDNNYPGSFEWIPASEFSRVYTGGRNGWCVILLAPSPPPPPRN